MASTVTWSVAALNELKLAAEYIERGSTAYASAFIQNAIRAADSMSEFLESGAIVPEFDSPMTREIFVHRYRLIYDIAGPDRLIVVAFITAREI